MKTLLIIAVFSVIKCKCDLIPIVDNVQYFNPVSNIREINISIVYVKDDSHTNDEFISALISGLYTDQPVVLATGDGFQEVRRALHNRNPNIIIITKALRLDDFKHYFYRIMFKTYWSPIYIMMTARNGNQTCKNGTVSEAFLETADKYMNEIWQRYQTVRIVIAFPYTCPNTFIIFSENILPSAKILYNRNIKVITANNKEELKKDILENSRLRQLTEGYPLRVSIFYRFPTSITECDHIHHYMTMNFNNSNGYCGMDGMVMHDFIEHYKYNVSVANDKRCFKYGYVEPRFHSATGSLGCVVRNQLDISFNSRFIVQYTTEHYFYLNYVSLDALCVVLKRPVHVPLWHYAYNMLNAKMWSILMFLMVTLGVTTWAGALLNKECSGKPKRLHTYIINSITCTLFGFAITKSCKRFHILRGTSLLCSIILIALFQGNVNYQFTTRTRYKEIKTLQQLYQSNNLLVTSPSILDILESSRNSEDKEQFNFIQKARIKNEEVGMEVALEPHIATLARGQDAEIECLQNFTDDSGSSRLYIIEECFQSYFLSFIARAGFLFVEESHNFMMRMLEAGLPDKYYVWTRRTIKLGDRYPRNVPEPRPIEKTKMRNLRVAFGILIFGYVASTCAFVVEKYRGSRR